MVEQYFNIIQKKPRTLLILLLILITIPASGFFKLDFTSDFRAYFSEENPRLKSLQEMEKHFSKQDNLFFLISSPEADLFSSRGLELIASLTQYSWSVAYVQRVDSLKNHQFTDVHQDELIVSDFYDLEHLPYSFDQLKQKALQEPGITPKLLSKDAKVTGVRLLLSLPDGQTSQASQEAVHSAQKLLNHLRPNYPEFLIELGGSTYINTTMGDAIKQDLNTLAPICYLVMFVIMWMLLKTMSGVLITTLLTGLSVLITMGTFGWLGYSITPPTSTVPTAIMTIAIADSIHILTSYYYFVRTGIGKEKALVSSLKINAMPVFITSLTTIVGVLALNTSDSPLIEIWAT